MNVKKPTTYDDLYPGRFLKAGSDVVQDRTPLTIKAIYNEDLEGDRGSETKAIIAFEETALLHVAPKTNTKCLAKMFGRKISNSIGKRVVLMSDKDHFGAELVDCVRIYGSPDIEADIEITLKRPKRRAVKRTLHAVGSKPTESATDKIVAAFRPHGIVLAELERKIGRDADKWSDGDIETIRGWIKQINAAERSADAVADLFA